MRAIPDNEFISLVATIPLYNAFFNKLYKIHLKIAVVLHSNLIVDCTLIGAAIGISEPKVFQFGTHFHVLSLQLPFALSLTFYQYIRGFMFFIFFRSGGDGELLERNLFGFFLASFFGDIIIWFTSSARHEKELLALAYRSFRSNFKFRFCILFHIRVIVSTVDSFQ